MRFAKQEDTAQLYFEHAVDVAEDRLFFAFTYPYTYSMVQADMALLDAFENNLEDPEAIYCKREVLTHSIDGRNVDLVTISASAGASASGEKEPLFAGLFPTSNSAESRPVSFPKKEVLFVSARVHPGEVPAQHTLKVTFI